MPDTGFQSTLPMKGATSAIVNFRMFFFISIHAPNEGSDPNGVNTFTHTDYFNPRSQ